MDSIKRVTTVNVIIFLLGLLGGFILLDSLLVGLFAGLAFSAAADFIQRRTASN